MIKDKRKMQTIEIRKRNDFFSYESVSRQQEL